MSELHITLVRQIEGHPTEADLELDCNQLDALSRTDRALALLQAYDSCVSALRDEEINAVCDEVKNLVPFPKKKDIPVK